jgi:hypothetical protein
LQFKIRDDATPVSLWYLDAVAVAVDRDYRDSAFVDSLPKAPADAVYGLLSLAPGRPGSYTVRVQARGFSLWTRTGVVVSPSANGCGVATETLVVDLRHEPHSE